MDIRVHELAPEGDQCLRGLACTPRPPNPILPRSSCQTPHHSAPGSRGDAWGSQVSKAAVVSVTALATLAVLVVGWALFRYLTGE